MENKFIPADEVGKIILDKAHIFMEDKYPDLKKDSKEYNELLAKLITYSFGGLYSSPMLR